MVLTYFGIQSYLHYQYQVVFKIYIIRRQYVLRENVLKELNYRVQQ